MNTTHSITPRKYAGMKIVVKKGVEIPFREGTKRRQAAETLMAAKTVDEAYARSVRLSTKFGRKAAHLQSADIRACVRAGLITVK